jgi:hypothetical protein
MPLESGAPGRGLVEEPGVRRAEHPGQIRLRAPLEHQAVELGVVLPLPVQALVLDLAQVQLEACLVGVGEGAPEAVLDAANLDHVRLCGPDQPLDLVPQLASQIVDLRLQRLHPLVARAVAGPQPLLLGQLPPELRAEVADGVALLEARGLLLQGVGLRQMAQASHVGRELDPPRPRRGEGLVEALDLRRHEVLAVLQAHRQDVVLLLEAVERELGLVELRAQVGELGAEVVEGPHGGGQAILHRLVDVLARDGVRDGGGALRVGVGDEDLHQAGVLHRLDGDPALEASRRDVDVDPAEGLDLLVGDLHEPGVEVQAELTDHPLGDEAAGDDPVLRGEELAAGPVVPEGIGHVLDLSAEGAGGSRVVLDDAAGLVDRRLLRRVQDGEAEADRGGQDDEPPEAQERPDVLRHVEPVARAGAAAAAGGRRRSASPIFDG